MKVDIIPIGNSRGVRIPKAMLEQCGFSETADLAVAEGRLILRPTPEARKGWDEAFQQMAVTHDDRLLETLATTFDEAEWTW